MEVRTTLGYVTFASNLDPLFEELKRRKVKPQELERLRGRIGVKRWPKFYLK